MFLPHTPEIFYKFYKIWKSGGFHRRFVLDFSQFLQFFRNIGLLPRTVSNTEMAFACGGGIDGPAQIQLADDAAGGQVADLTQQLGHLLVGNLAGTVGVNADRNRLCHTDGIGQLHLNLISQTCSHQILGHIAGHVCTAAVHLGGILAGEGAATVGEIAAVGNAKSKIIEPYFNEINRDYCQLLPNWSGHNITSNPDNQPNFDAYNHNRKLLPTEDECIAQIHEIMRQERAKKIAAYMEAWKNTPDERKIPFCDEEYLMLMGETTGRTNRLSGQGLMIEMMGERINYESFSFELREHYNEDWVVRYDPDDLSQVMITNAKATKGHRVLEEIGTLAYMMQRTMKVPMALVDQKPEHHEYRKQVREFNEEFERRYVDKQTKVDDMLDSLREELPALSRNNLLQRALITDSKGQHKDRRYESRSEVEEAFIIEEAPRHTFVPVHDDDDDDYEFKPTDMNFSR